MNFATKNIAVDTTTGSGSKYMSVGINDNVALEAIEAGESSKGTPFIEVFFSKGEDSLAKDKFYMSEKAQEKSQQKLIHLLVDGLGVDRDKVDAAGEAATSLEDYAKKLNVLIPKGNLFRMKFSGEEYDSAGTTKVAKRITFIPFCEAMSVSPTKLKYDQKNKYDYVALPKPDGDLALAGGADDTSSLPF